MLPLHGKFFGAATVTGLLRATGQEPDYCDKPKIRASKPLPKRDQNQSIEKQPRTVICAVGWHSTKALLAQEEELDCCLSVQLQLFPHFIIKGYNSPFFQCQTPKGS